MEGLPPGSREVLARPLDWIELSARVRRVFNREGFKTVGDVLAQTPMVLLRLSDFGRGSYNEVCRQLEKAGVELPIRWRNP